MRSSRLHCYSCGRFIAFSDPNAIAWIPYGGSLDAEPPEERAIHKACWDLLELRSQNLIILTAWQGPYWLHNPQGEIKLLELKLNEK